MMHFVMSLALFFMFQAVILCGGYRAVEPGQTWEAGKTGDERARSGKESNKMQLP